MTRDFRFDLLKALAIGMVVLGHVTSTHELSPHGSGMMGDFIVGLNMPLFFVISGYFATRAVADVGKTVRRCLKYLRAMFAYSVLLAVTFYGLGTYDTLLLACKRVLTIPICGWWFMWSLMYSMVVLCCLQRIRNLLPSGSSFTALVLLFGYFMILAMPDSWYQVKYFKFCFPFFVVGCFWGCHRNDIHLRPLVPCVAWGVAAVFYSLYLYWVAD